MKICVTSQGKTLESQVDPRFGRCAYFVIVDPQNLAFEAIENVNAVSGGGAGIQSGQLMNEKRVKVLFTGNVGPNAFDTLKAAGIEIVTGVSGTVRDAVARFASGAYSAVSSATVDSHSGMKGGK